MGCVPLPWLGTRWLEPVEHLVTSSEHACVNADTHGTKICVSQSCGELLACKALFCTCLLQSSIYQDPKFTITATNSLD